MNTVFSEINMCRLVAYLGKKDVLLGDVLVKPVNSLVSQSLQARETNIPTNGDGFGLGWYVPEINSEPALFTSTTPAWSDRNLLHLTSKIKSSAFFAHVRAASEGGVTQYNCHPFVFEDWMLMHNGCIDGFIHVKRHLRRLLDDDIYNWIKGDTDSEHLFALFLQLAKGRDLSTVGYLSNILEETFTQVLALAELYNSGGVSYFNVCLTDGRRMIASRYCNDPDNQPLSMHYCVGNHLLIVDKESQFNTPLMSKEGSQQCVLVSSEKLSNVTSEWHMVPSNHWLLVDEDYTVTLRRLRL